MTEGPAPRPAPHYQLNAALNSLSLWSHPAWGRPDRDLLHVAAVSQLVKHHRTRLATRQPTVADLAGGVAGRLPASRLARYGDFRYNQGADGMLATNYPKPSAQESLCEAPPAEDSAKPEVEAKQEDFHLHSIVNDIMDHLTKTACKSNCDANMDEWLNMLNTILNDVKCLVLKRGVELDEWTKVLLRTCMQFIAAARVNDDLTRLMETDVAFIINFEKLWTELVSREELLSVPQPPLPLPDEGGCPAVGRLWIKLSTPTVRCHWTSDERSTMFGHLPPAVGEALGWASNVVGVTNFLRREAAGGQQQRSQESPPDTQPSENSSWTPENLLGSLLHHIDTFNYSTGSTTPQQKQKSNSRPSQSNFFPQAHGTWNKDLFPRRLSFSGQATYKSDPPSKPPPTTTASAAVVEKLEDRPSTSAQNSSSALSFAAVCTQRVAAAQQEEGTSSTLQVTSPTLQVTSNALPAKFLQPLPKAEVPSAGGHGQGSRTAFSFGEVCCPWETDVQQETATLPSLPLMTHALQSRLQPLMKPEALPPPSRVRSSLSTLSFAEVCSLPGTAVHHQEDATSSPLQMMVPALPPHLQPLPPVVHCRPGTDPATGLPVSSAPTFRNMSPQVRSWVQLPPLQDHQIPFFMRHPPPPAQHPFFRGRPFDPTFAGGNWRDAMEQPPPQHPRSVFFKKHQLKTKRLAVAGTVSKTSCSTEPSVIHIKGNSHSKHALGHPSVSGRRCSVFGSTRGRHPGLSYRIQTFASSRQKPVVKVTREMHHPRFGKGGKKNKNKNEDGMHPVKQSRSSIVGMENWKPVERRDNLLMVKNVAQSDASEKLEPAEGSCKNADEQAEMTDLSMSVNKCCNGNQMMQNAANSGEVSNESDDIRSQVGNRKSLDSLDTFDEEIAQYGETFHDVRNSVSSEWPSLRSAETKSNAWSSSGQKILWSEHFKTGFDIRPSAVNSLLRNCSSTPSTILKDEMEFRCPTPIEKVQASESFEAIALAQESEWPKPSMASKLIAKNPGTPSSDRSQKKKKKTKCKRQIGLYLDDQIVDIDSDSSVERVGQCNTKKNTDVDELNSPAFPAKSMSKSGKKSLLSTVPSAPEEAIENGFMSSGDPSVDLNSLGTPTNTDIQVKNRDLEVVKSDVRESANDVLLALRNTNSCDSSSGDSDDGTTSSLNASSDDDTTIHNETDSTLSPGREAVNITNRMFENHNFLNRKSKEEVHKWYAVARDYGMSVTGPCHGNKVNGWSHFRTAIQTILKNVLESIHGKDKFNL